MPGGARGAAFGGGATGGGGAAASGAAAGSSTCARATDGLPKAGVREQTIFLPEKRPKHAAPYPGAGGSEVPRMSDQSFGFQVHEGGDRTLDGIFRLIGLGDRDEPLAEVLTAMCADVATIARADVASVYVREDGADGPRFTMRGNVGFPPEALGRVHLRPGEGITGFAADRLRPVSVAMGERDEHFKYIGGLGEERFPSLLAVPVVRGGAAGGVLVLQRGTAEAFTNEEVVLASALAAVISHALERGEARDRRRADEADHRAVRLEGQTISGGAAMGHTEMLPTLAALARAPLAPSPNPGGSGLPELLRRLETDLLRVTSSLSGRAARDITSLALILEDRRFREKLAAACASPAPLKALSELARAYARVPFASADSAATVELLGDRAAEIEDLCVLAHGTSTGRRFMIRSGGIVVSERLRLFSTLHALAAGASAFVVDAAVEADAAPAAIVRAAGRPLLASVAGVFSWLRADDLLVVDADAGVLRINPPATTVARFRSDRR
jgi:phosphotransferase system, enzyme I, PtsP